MAGWFKEQQAKPESTTSIRQPITDYEELIETYNILMKKIDTFMNEANQVQYPDTTELFGDDPESPTPQGLIGEIRRQLKNSPLMRTELGRMMWDATKRMENLGAWNARYAQQLESYLDGLKFTNESAFTMVETIKKQLDEMHTLKKEYEESIDVKGIKDTATLFDDGFRIRRKDVKPPEKKKPIFKNKDVPGSGIPSNLDENAALDDDGLTEDQRMSLVRLYNTISSSTMFTKLVSDSSEESKSLTVAERKYLVKLNKKTDKFIFLSFGTTFNSLQDDVTPTGFSPKSPPPERMLDDADAPNDEENDSGDEKDGY